MLLLDWFDPHNTEHVKAYKHLMLFGQWPDGFLPENVIFPAGTWRYEIAQKLAAAWALHLDQVLSTDTDTGKVKKALDLIEEWGGIDGAHHKQWLLDQLARTLSDDYGACMGR